mgnify:CR=1 FL=1
MSGIFRDVYLFATPKVHIRDFWARTDLDKEYRDATLKVRVHIKNYSAFPANGYRVEAVLFDENNQPVDWSGSAPVAVDPEAESVLELSGEVTTDRGVAHTLMERLVA